jgi:hypothetical protein
MPTYYFDTQDGVPVRDRTGQILATTGVVIEHSKQLAPAMPNERQAANEDLHVMVLDESGRKVHREPIYRAGAVSSVKIVARLAEHTQQSGERRRGSRARICRAHGAACTKRFTLG